MENRTEECRALYRTLSRFDVDGKPCELTFARRLARENGWTTDYAERVVQEYFKFVALSMYAGHMVTPSEQVDEAWHLHMIYTRSYWERFVPLLPKPLHHTPTAGGTSEDQKFEDLYVRTLAKYQEAFGDPPRDVWPPVGDRFAGGQWRKIWANQYWLVPRKSVRFAAQIAASLGILGVLAGCVATALPGQSAIIMVFVLGGIVLVTLIVAAIVQANKHRGHQGNDFSSSGCSTGTYSGGYGYHHVGGRDSDGPSSSDSGSSNSGGWDSGGSDGGDGGGGGCGGGCGGGD